MLKSISKIWWLIAFVLIYFFLSMMQWLPKGFNLFSKDPVLIKETPIEIEQIRAMGTLITAEFYGEVYADLGEVYTMVIHRYQEAQNPNMDSLTQIYTQIDRFIRHEQDVDKINNLVYIGRGWAKAGSDLSQLTEDNFELRGGKSDTLFVSIPFPEIITTNINPWYTENNIPGYEIFIGENLKTLSDHEVREVKKLCIVKLKQEAIKAGILERAAHSAELTLSNFFRLLGYENVSIEMNNRMKI